MDIGEQYIRIYKKSISGNSAAELGQHYFRQNEEHTSTHKRSAQEKTRSTN